MFDPRGSLLLRGLSILSLWITALVELGQGRMERGEILVYGAAWVVVAGLLWTTWLVRAGWIVGRLCRSARPVVVWTLEYLALGVGFTGFMLAYLDPPASSETAFLRLGAVALLFLVFALYVGMDEVVNPAYRTWGRHIVLFSTAVPTFLLLVFNGVAVVAETLGLFRRGSDVTWFIAIVGASVAMVVSGFADITLDRADEIEVRARRNAENEARAMAPWYSGVRESTDPGGEADECLRLIDSSPHLTIGLAGRRGVGKSRRLASICHSFVREEYANEKLEQSGLANAPEVERRRIRRMQMLLHTPTAFDELGFLVAIYEQVALMVNRHVVRLLPAVQPFSVELELQRKRSVLRTVHGMYVIAALVSLVVGIWVFAGVEPADPVAGALAPGWVAESHRAPEREPMYLATRDSFRATMSDSLAALEDRIARASPDSGVADTLRRRNVPGLAPADSAFFAVRRTHARFSSRLDSIAAFQERKYQLRDSLAAYREQWGLGTARWPIKILFYLGLLGTPLWLGWVGYATQEGVRLLQRKEYDILRDEVALYQRTHAVLERLRYSMTVAESREASVGLSLGRWAGGAGANLLGKRSSQTSRQLRPFTIFSVVDEFRSYCRDVVFYLNQADGRSRPRVGVKILIAIDELDKIVDSARLNEMLKSTKALFDLESFYYVFSISEDALETYRLRHVETKSEIDSAFTHILYVPPIPALDSLRFFAHEYPRLASNLIPAAIAFGGGVPRDMHRIAQIIRVRRDWNRLEAVLDGLFVEDLEAVLHVIRHHQCLSDQARHHWIAMLPSGWTVDTSAVDARLGEIERMSFDLFGQDSPCDGAGAKESFHRVRSLLRTIWIKAYIYRRVSDLSVPEEILVPGVMARVTEGGASIEVKAWVLSLERLRDAIYHLAANPLGVWAELKADSSAG